jgi:hypothetical protein
MRQHCLKYEIICRRQNFYFLHITLFIAYSGKNCYDFDKNISAYKYIYSDLQSKQKFISLVLVKFKSFILTNKGLRAGLESEAGEFITGEQ